MMDAPFNVTVAEALKLLMAELVAVMVAVAPLALTVAGAVYKPEFESVPGPERLQVTADDETPDRVAENWAVPPAESVVLVGLTLIVCALMWIVAEAFSELTALLVTVTVAVPLEVELAGAVYRPLLESDPGPDRLQLTELSETPVKLAANCVVSPASRVAFVGVIEMV